MLQWLLLKVKTNDGGAKAEGLQNQGVQRTEFGLPLQSTSHQEPTAFSLQPYPSISGSPQLSKAPSLSL